MSLLIRKILLIVFILIFFTVSPLLVLYAFGYQLNWQVGNWQRTGMLVIKTEPGNARIYIDGELQTSLWTNIFQKPGTAITSPAKIKGVFPGEYLVRLELDGYQPWEKRLTVWPNESVFIEDVRFFNNSLPWQIADLDLKQLTQVITAPNQQQQAVIIDQQLFLADLEKKTVVPWQIFKTTLPQNFSWSSDSQHLLADLTVLALPNSTTTAKQIIDLSSLLPTGSTMLKWSEVNKLSYLTKTGLYFFDLNNQKQDLIYSLNNVNNISDYLVKDGSLYLIIKNQGRSSLIAIDLDDDSKQSLDLSLSGEYNFLRPNNSWLNIYNEANSTLYLVDPRNLVLDKMQSLACTCYQWLANNQLLYADGFEIWIWNVPANKKRLLTRVSDKISNVFWHPSNNYIIYNTAKQINSLELDDRDRHLINTLAEINNIQYLEMSTDGQAVYFYATIGQQAGLYQLDI